MKINLGEKALMERRLPTDIMSKILSSAENANNGTPRKRSKSASEDATSDDQKKSGKKKKKSGSDDFVSEDRKREVPLKRETMTSKRRPHRKMILIREGVSNVQRSKTQ